MAAHIASVSFITYLYITDLSIIALIANLSLITHISITVLQFFFTVFP